MKLEDTIKHRLFRPIGQGYEQFERCEFIIECKAEAGKPIPLCIPDMSFRNADIVYRRLYFQSLGPVYEKSTPRAMYNMILNTSYFPNLTLLKAKVKDNFYYATPGALFNSDKYPLFWFASEDREGTAIPRLYITPVLLRNAALPGKPMEKFFMSTVVPYVLSNQIRSITGSYKDVIVEISNEPDDVFFIPQSSMLSSVAVDKVNDNLNDILADNADVLSTFIDNYCNTPLR